MVSPELLCSGVVYGAIELSIATGLVWRLCASDPFDARSQNIVRNCGAVGAYVAGVTGSGNIAFVGNQFGECGFAVAGMVMIFEPTQGPNDITVMNNVYQGLANSLKYFMQSSGHLNFVSGNTQTQTALPNNLP